MLLLVIAYGVRRLPYIVRAAVAGLEQTSGELEEAALNLGAGRVRAVRTIIVPLIMANLIAGGLLAFSFAMLEVSDSSSWPSGNRIIRSPRRSTHSSSDWAMDPTSPAPMGVWAMVLLAVTLIGASILMGKKMGAIFRV